MRKPLRCKVNISNPPVPARILQHTLGRRALVHLCTVEGQWKGNVQALLLLDTFVLPESRRPEDTALPSSQSAYELPNLVPVHPPCCISYPLLFFFCHWHAIIMVYEPTETLVQVWVVQIHKKNSPIPWNTFKWHEQVRHERKQWLCFIDMGADTESGWLAHGCAQNILLRMDSKSQCQATIPVKGPAPFLFPLRLRKCMSYSSSFGNSEKYVRGRFSPAEFGNGWWNGACRSHQPPYRLH